MTLSKTRNNNSDDTYLTRPLGEYDERLLSEPPNDDQIVRGLLVTVQKKQQLKSPA